jgi:hypothetical protein
VLGNAFNLITYCGALSWYLEGINVGGFFQLGILVRKRFQDCSYMGGIFKPIKLISWVYFPNKYFCAENVFRNVSLFGRDFFKWNLCKSPRLSCLTFWKVFSLNPYPQKIKTTRRKKEDEFRYRRTTTDCH